MNYFLLIIKIPTKDYIVKCVLFEFLQCLFSLKIHKIQKGVSYIAYSNPFLYFMSYELPKSD